MSIILKAMAAQLYSGHVVCSAVRNTVFLHICHIENIINDETSNTAYNKIYRGNAALILYLNTECHENRML